MITNNMTAEDRMREFFGNTSDSYAILQLKREEKLDDLRFMRYSYLEGKGIEPFMNHYEVVYHGSLEKVKATMEQLEDLFVKFNIDHPSDFRGHSMSVSDIVALKISGEISYYYVDAFGFKYLPNFTQKAGADD